jgi:uncharacterized membrane protein
MIPFILLVFLFAFLSLLGHLQIPVAFGWWTSLRLSLAGMYLLTASAHWGKRRPDLLRMVPPSFPRAGLLVTMTGVLEILGAIGLTLPKVAPYAALGLAFMLVAVFPANIHAARQHLTIGGRAVEATLPRTLLQIVFLTATIAVFAGSK